MFGNFEQSGATTQQGALSRYMMSAWAGFAKNPGRGPGWNRVGTGIGGEVLIGAYEEGVGGLYTGGNGNVLEGDWNLGVLGNAGGAKGSGVTVVRQAEVDGKCELFRELFENVVGKEGMPPV